MIEPDIVYRYVNGVNDFGRFVRFDEDETLTDTNEVEYGITQRLFRRTARAAREEFITWRLVQKYFFDPTFGGALVPGQPNVFQTLDALTPFAFADVARHFSPIVSDLTIEPGKRCDTQFIVNYDPQRNRLTAIGTLLKLKPYKESFLTLAHFSTLNLPLNPSPFRLRISSSARIRCARFCGLRRHEPPRLERDRGRELRLHPGRVSEPDRGGQLQRLVLRHRLRIPPLFVRHDPQRKSVQRRIPHRESRLRRKSAAPGKNLLGRVA